MYSINLNLSCSLLFLFIGTFGLVSPILFMSNTTSGIVIGCAIALSPYVASFMFFIEWRKERQNTL